MSDLSGPARLPSFAATDRTPSRIAGRYDLGEVIGVGAPAWVYRAEDRETGQIVAVKLYPAGFGGPDEARRQREMGELSELHHPHLVELLDAGDESGRAYLVMELVEARTLAQRVLDGPMAAADVARLGADLGYGLAYLHSRGITHRTVKPANVFLGARPMLADFGIASLVDRVGVPGTGSLIGTPAYLAPEQVDGSEVGMPADVYALGLILLEALTGRREFEGDGPETAHARLSRRPSIPPDVPALTDLLHAMTAMDPAVRPTAGVVSESLRGAAPKLDGVESVRPTSDSERPRPRISTLERLEDLDSLPTPVSLRRPVWPRFPGPEDAGAPEVQAAEEGTADDALVEDEGVAADDSVAAHGTVTANDTAFDAPTVADYDEQPGPRADAAAMAEVPAENAEVPAATAEVPVATTEEPAAFDGTGQIGVSPETGHAETLAASAALGVIGAVEAPAAPDDADRPDVSEAFDDSGGPKVPAALADTGTKVLQKPPTPPGLPLPPSSWPPSDDRHRGRRRLLAAVLGLTGLAAATVGVLASWGSDDETPPGPGDSASVDTPVAQPSASPPSPAVPPAPPAPIVAPPGPVAPPAVDNGGGGGGGDGNKHKGGGKKKKH